jgi:hypothetical protein
LINMKAKRKSQRSTAKNGNVQKHDTYQEAFARIKDAINQGFFIEAVAIQEAIISDRLRSHLGHHHALPERETFYELVDKWKALEGRGRRLTVSIELPELVNLWREQRNNAIHGFISDESHIDVFLKNAQVAAATGLQLTRALCDWHKKEIRKNTPRKRLAKKK